MKALTYLEHLTSTLAVAGGDEWSMDVQEAMLLKKVVGCKSQGIAYPGDGSYCVCPAGLTKVSDTQDPNDIPCCSSAYAPCTC